MVREYVVVGTKQETRTTTTLALTFLDGSIPSYIPGQYLTIYFPYSTDTKGKAYSISSGPSEQTLAITVRAMGEFSNRLCALKPGDTILASLPQGTFYPEQAGVNLVLLAGGIGITPFRSIMCNAIRRSLPPDLYLFYSIPLLEETLFEDQFNILAKQYGNLHIKKYVTRESLTAPLALVRRITPEDILRTIHDTVYSEFLISGPTSFVRGQRSGLVKAGISEEYIHTEICL